MARSIALMLRRINDRAPFHMLPAELLVQILSHTYIHDLFSASYVCHSRRRAVLETAYLWADMRYFGRVSPCLPVAFRRAKEHNIILDAALSSAPAFASRVILSCIQSRLSHIRTLHIEIDPHDVYDLGIALSNPSPILEDFSLRVRDSNGLYRFRNYIFNDFAPRLQHLALSGFRNLSATSVFRCARVANRRATILSRGTCDCTCRDAAA